jgi:hypothetical protein
LRTFEQKYNQKDIDRFISRAHKHFTDREHTFLQSIRQQLDIRPTLSYSQEQWLGKIMSKYSQSALKIEADWAKNFTAEHRLTAIQVAKYYIVNPPYYNEIARRVLASPETAVLSRSTWDKFCENKYALKIREMYLAPLKFALADCIIVRSNNRIDLANTIDPKYSNRRACRQEANKVGFILETDVKPVTRAAKGSRVYKILLTGEPKPIFAHESDLKRNRQCT